MEIRSVLLVDDDKDIRLVGRLILESVGQWRVLLASSGDEAIALAARERPDVILLDMVMPEKDGTAVLADLRSLPETASIPVIFLTAKAQERDRVRYLGLGAAGVITKPFEPMALPREIRSILGAAGRP